MGRGDWSSIELILSEFGAPDVSNWGSDEDYAVSRLRRSDDGTLLALNAYLRGDDGGGSGGGTDDPTVVGPWGDGEFRLFLSHTSDHKVFANNVAEALRGEFGINAFVAHEAIKPSRAWEQEIEVALATCEGMLALVTPDFIGSEYCDQEVGWVMGHNLPILAAMKGATPHGFVGKWQGLPVKSGPTAALELAETVFDTLATHDRSKYAIARSIVYRFVNSRNFEEAKWNTGHLLEISKELWTPQMVEEVEVAVQENLQLKERFWGIGTVPKAIKDHFDKMFDRDPIGDRASFAPSGATDDDIPF
jgi:TIR domain-containing protein